MSETCTPDEMEIRELISRQFECLNWSPDEDANWDGLVDGFVAGATLFGAKRPASPQTPEEFAERMKALRDNQGVLEFAEKGICCEVFVPGHQLFLAGQEPGGLAGRCAGVGLRRRHSGSILGGRLDRLSAIARSARASFGTGLANPLPNAVLLRRGPMLPRRLPAESSVA